MPVSTQPLTRQDRAHVLRQGFHDEILGLLMFAAALALWLFTMITQDGPKDAQVNEAFVGLVLMFVAGRRLYRGGGVLSDVVIGLGGLWMIASPFVLGLQNTAMNSGTRIFDIAVGTVLVVLAAISLLVLRRDRQATGGQEHRPSAETVRKAGGR
ncbi:SPW repeat protein [Streptomyces sp. BR123]|uniref:SPW repeat protein n=1 Tax=Streptomyces sp. BR123 TaxID=2749828 RepID=UPI0015C46AA9|nr:SPW repeat protein [Streptomyces sp. BR123]NXY93238.1 SPW repeat protein [Streptomyces sp. BR123]